MLAQTLIISDGKLLMVQQKTKRVKIIWNFPEDKLRKVNHYRMPLFERLKKKLVMKLNY
jgi:hypothetical protein